MNKLVPTAITSMSLLMLLGASPSQAAQCADVESATMALRSTGLNSARGESVQSPRDRQGTRQGGSLSGYRNQDVQSPRDQDVQAPRNQDVQSPRNQDVQSPRNQDVQSPRNQDVQSPRTQDVQSPRNQDIQSPRSQDIQSPRGATAQQQRAVRLVNEASAACEAGKPTLASQKAREAMALLRK